MIEISLDSIQDHRESLLKLWSRELDGFIIRKLVDRHCARSIVEFTKNVDSSFPVTNYYWGKVYGRVLTSSFTHINEYFRDASRYESELPREFGINQSWQQFFGEILSKLYGNQAKVPEIKDGCHANSSTIRVIADGCELPTHCGNQFTGKRKQYNDLRDITTDDDQVAYFMVLQKPYRGGEFTIFNTCWEEHKNNYLKGKDTISSIESSDSLKLSLEVGDLIIFQGGQLYHKVEKVFGEYPRITMGGFMTPSSDEKILYYWS